MNSPFARKHDRDPSNHEFFQVLSPNRIEQCTNCGFRAFWTLPGGLYSCEALGCIDRLMDAGARLQALD